MQTPAPLHCSDSLKQWDHRPIRPWSGQLQTISVDQRYHQLHWTKSRHTTHEKYFCNTYYGFYCPGMLNDFCRPEVTSVLDKKQTVRRGIREILLQHTLRLLLSGNVDNFPSLGRVQMVFFYRISVLAPTHQSTRHRAGTFDLEPVLTRQAEPLRSFNGAVRLRNAKEADETAYTYI